MKPAKSLQNLINKQEKLYEDSNSDGMKKEIEAEIEKIDKESQVKGRIVKANDTIFVLEARINEYRDNAQKLAIGWNWIRIGAKSTLEKKQWKHRRKGRNSHCSMDTEDINSQMHSGYLKISRRSQLTKGIWHAAQ